MADVQTQEANGDFDAQAISYQHGVLLVDRTGSMMGIRSATGNRRCQDAIVQAKEKVERFFNALNGQGVAIWGFRNSTISPFHPGYLNEARALDLLDNLDPNGCHGSTPLAEAMCNAADGVAGAVSLSPKPGYLHVATDGGENNSSGACSGPSGHVYEAGTWQFKVRRKIAIAGIVPVDVAYWVEPTVLRSLDIDPETGEPRTVIQSDPTAQFTCRRRAECESSLWAALSADTGGDYEVVTDTDTDYPCSFGNCPAPKNPDTGLEPWSF